MDSSSFGNIKRVSNGVYNELEIVNDDEDDGIFSKANRKKSASQYCAVSAVCVVTLAFGMSYGFTTILIPELKKNDTEITATPDEISWISAMNIVTIPLGAVVSGPLAQFMGRRNSLKLAVLIYIAAWLVLYYAGSVRAIYLGLMTLGLTSGLVESPVQVYVMETCEARVRGSASATLSASFAIGVFLEIVIGSYVYWRTLVLGNLVALLFALVTLHLVPETPYWLASKGRYEEARRALSWVRGWTTSDRVEDEYRVDLEGFARNHQEKLKLGRANDSFVRRFFRPGVMRPFLLITCMFLINSFNGSGPIFTYAVLIFQSFNLTVNEYTITMVMSGFSLVGILLSVYIIGAVGKKAPTLWSLGIGGVATLVVVVYEYMHHNRIFLTEENYNSWIPVSGVIVSVVATSVGIKVTPWILAGEIFPGDVRGLAAGIVGAICNIFGAIANKTFQGMVDNFGLNGTFLIYTLVYFVGFVILYFLMPETDGMSLTEIETLFAGKKKIKGEVELSPLTNHGWVGGAKSLS